MRRIPLNAVAGALLLSLITSGAPARAVAARWHTGLTSRPTQERADIAALRYLDEHGHRLGLRGVELGAARTTRWHGSRLVRIGQEVDGVPVVGAGIVMRLDAAGRIRTVVDYTARSLDVIPDPVLSPREALERVSERWGGARPGLPEVTLVVLPGARAGALAWQVDARRGWRRFRLYVDALDGRIRRVEPLHRSAQGYAYPENPTVTPAPQLVTLHNLDASELTLSGRAGTVYRYIYGFHGLVEPPEAEQDWLFEQLATPDASGLFDYAPVPGATDDPFAEVSAYYHLDRVDTYFRDVHGHVPQSQVLVMVNMTEDGAPFHNAFHATIDSTRTLLGFGQGNVDYAYDGDVVYHEFGHFFVRETADLRGGFVVTDATGVNIAPGAINEGTADYVAVALSGNSAVGEYAMSGGRDTANDYVCPDSFYGESHNDGRIVGGAGWDLRSGLGDPAAADAIFFGAVVMLPPDASFRDFALALVDTAEALRDGGRIDQAAVDTVSTVVTDRGLLACGRYLTLDDGASRTTGHLGLDFVAAVIGHGDCVHWRQAGAAFPGSFQYRISVPATHDHLQLRIQHTPPAGIAFDVYVRRGAPVSFEAGALADATGFGSAVPTEYDYVFAESFTGAWTADIDLDAAPPLVPGEDYYLSIVHRNCSYSTVTVEGETWAVGQPDAGAHDAGGDQDAAAPATDAAVDPRTEDAGCSCAHRAPGPTPPPLLPLLPLLLILGLRWRFRRRRHRP